MVAPIIPMVLGAGLRYAPHIMRYIYPRVAPKAIAGAKRFGQLMKANPKSALSTSAMMMLGNMVAPEKAHAPSNPSLQNMLQLQKPLLPYTVPRAEIPLGVDQHSPLPNALQEAPQDLKPHINEQMQPLETAPQAPPREPTDAEKFLQSNTYKFFQSDAYQKLKDIFAGMAESSSDGSGWDALASGVKRLNEGDKQRGQVNQTVEYLKSKGYSEEEAAIMARNPQMLSAMLTGGDTSKLLAGHEFYTDPETGERGQRPMKGSLLELEYNQKKRDIEEWEINKRDSADRAASEINNIMDTVNNALNIIEKNPKKVTGVVGSMSQILPGSDARTLKNKLKQLEGGIFTRVIETIKKQSDGGKLGVGPLSNEESRRIVASYGTMDISDKPEELYKTLLKIKDMFDLFKKLNDEEIYRLSNGMEVRRRLKSSAQYSTDQQAVVEFVKVFSPKESTKFEIGTKIQDADGNIRIKRY